MTPRQTRPVSRYLLLLTLGVALPLLVLAGVIAVIYGERERSEIQAEAVTRASALANSVDRELRGLAAATEVLSLSPLLEEGQFDEFDRLARAAASRIGLNVVVRNRAHDQVVNTRLPRGAALPRNAEGESDRDVLVTGKAQVSNVFIGGVTGSPLVMVNAPVFSGGEVRWFVNVSIPPERIRDVLVAEDMPAGWWGAVIDRKGMVIAQTGSQYAGAGKPAPGDLVAYAAGKPVGLWQGTGRDGEGMAVAFARSPVSGWLVTAALPASALNAPLADALWMLGGIAALLVGLSAAIATVVGRWMSRSIVDLAMAGQALAANTPLPPASSPITEVETVHRVLAAAAGERRERENDLRQSEERLRLFIEHAPAAIAMFDRDMLYLATSQRWRDDFGLETDPVGRSHYELFPEIPSHWREVHRRALRGEALSAKEDPFRRASGALQYLNWDCRPWRHADGRIAGLMIGAEDVTQRVVAAQETARLAAIVTSSSDAIIAMTLDGTITSWNAAAERLFGYSAAEMTGQPVTRLLPPGRVAETGRNLAAVAAGHAVDRYETERLARDGRTIEVAVTLSPILDRSGRVTGASKFASDISEAKRAERALRDRDWHLRLVLGAASAVTYEWDIAADAVVRLYSSEAALPETGGAAETLEMVVDRVHPDDRGLFREGIRRALETGTYRSEHRVVRPDGGVAWLHERGRVERDERGRAVRLLGISFDITERKRIEQQLAEQRRLYKSVTDNATTALFIMDERQHCVFMNPAAERLTGYTLEDTRGRPLHDVLHHTRPDGRPYPLAECPIDQAFPKNDREQGEEVFVHRDGHFYPVAFTASPIRGNAGDPVGTVIEVEDITGRKQREEQVLLLMREVNHRAKNMLSVVQSIARHTVASDPADFVRRFSERLQSLAANQDLLVRNDWTGVPLDALVRSQLAPFKDLLGSRIVLRGPPLRFNPAASQVIGLALHELATNAGKYGALSNDSGRVTVAWRQDGDRVEFSWTERGGPPVAAPAHTGFGTTVVTRLARLTVYGEASVSYDPEGFSWKLTCPAARAIEAAPALLPVPGEGVLPS